MEIYSYGRLGDTGLGDVVTTRPRVTARPSVADKNADKKVQESIRVYKRIKEYKSFLSRLWVRI